MRPKTGQQLENHRICAHTLLVNITGMLALRVSEWEQANLDVAIY